MAKETPFATATWHSSPPPPPSFFNLNSWDHSSDFESALSSLVSSPTSADPSAGGLVIHELIGRLGTISNSGELSMPPFAAAHLAPPLSADPGFVERAARFSCFAGGMGGQLGLPEPGRLSRVSSSQSLMAAGSQLGDVSMPERSQFAREEPSASGPNPASNSRKRKTAPKTKAKDNPSPKVQGEECNAKRSKSTEVKPKAEQNGGEASGNGGDSGPENNAKPPEPPKQDYIHVRARRGQATDSHSLAERVRREKISERMKLLQDLVPGCNKITGKAVMLDEIINYVQSLQRQVEFLSMKLSTVNTRLDFNMDNFFPKDMQQMVYPIETAAMTSMYAHQPQCPATNGLETQCSVDPSDANLRRALCMQLPPLDGFGEAASQLGNFWEDDLQSVVQMGLVQNKEAAFSSNNYFQGSLPSSQMKIEL